MEEKVREEIGYQRIKWTIEYYEKVDEIPDPLKIGRPIKAIKEVLMQVTALTLNDRSISYFKISESLKKKISKLKFLQLR